MSLTLEGFMLSGAFGAALGTHYSGSPVVGVLSGILCTEALKRRVSDHVWKIEEIVALLAD